MLYASASHRFSLLVGLLLLVTTGSTQAQTSPSLWAQHQYLSDSTAVLSWVPTRAEDWAMTRASGFEVVRYDAPALDNYRDAIDWDAVATGRPTTILSYNPLDSKIADSISLANDTLWGQGYPQIVATMLFDSAFNDGNDQEGINRQQYDMIQFGAVNFAVQIGTKIGLAIIDNNVNKSASYLYRVTSIDNPELTQEIYVVAGGGGITRFFADIDNDFTQHPYAFLLPPEPTTAPLLSRGKAFGDSIVVRWLPLESPQLRNGYKQGYYLTKIRRTPGTDPAKPFDFNYEILADSIPVLPWSKDSLGRYLSINPAPDSNLLIAAQVMYGKLQSEDGLNRAEALQNQLAYGLQAADQSPIAAEVMGLRYVDYDVTPGEFYIYEITMPVDSLPYDYPAQASVKLDNDYQGPTPLRGVAAIEGEYVINLVLDRENELNYNQYFFEKSKNGNNWEKLNVTPIVFEVSEELADQVRYYYFPDSVANLYDPHLYRVRGRNAFQEYSPWVELTAQARDRTPPPTSTLNEPETLTSEIVRLSWDAEMSETAPDLAGYYVKMGHTPSPENQPIVSELLPPGTTTYDYQRPGYPFTNDTAYFFQIAAVDTAGNISSSFPVALRVIDSIPPAPPTGLQGTMDSNGVVTILWEASPETDAVGYQVYFANDTTDYFVQITKGDLAYNYFLDTIEVNALNEAIYYRVTAFDRSYNTSKFSEILKVERPDVIAPTPPVLLQPKPTGEAVELTWKPSSSTDAVAYAVLRRDPNSEAEAWTVLDSIAALLTTYVDTSAEFEVAYDYTLTTIDDAGLVSELANIQTGRRIFTADIGGVETVTIELQGEGEGARPQVQWTFEKPTVDILAEADHRFMLYRAAGDGELTRYKQLRGKEPVYVDESVDPGTTYRYALMVVYDNGKKSALSQSSSVTIPDTED